MLQNIFLTHAPLFYIIFLCLKGLLYTQISRNVLSRWLEFFLLLVFIYAKMFRLQKVTKVTGF